ncbi:hypothetical protein [Meiothermus sp. CFH 77666]|uniref:hypothetical protein n=1 Tax=Meiothermus sp. CFH 77666 TaxID=2817942 RepID=UPI001AA04057|nr:hypothetical protein [Meiothermus sp. CFH 77666]MBO1438605.1 hypothetical protein [Meiothermus sp. CFH 77666]
MKVASHPRLTYISLYRNEAWCNVDVYREGSKVLVVLRDQDENDDESLTNTIDSVAYQVRLALDSRGLGGMEIQWIQWSRADKLASIVTFEDEVFFNNPSWQYLSRAQFQKILEDFGAPDQLETWIREGTIEF